MLFLDVEECSWFVDLFGVVIVRSLKWNVDVMDWFVYFDENSVINIFIVLVDKKFLVLINDFVIFIDFNYIVV